MLHVAEWGGGAAVGEGFQDFMLRVPRRKDAAKLMKKVIITTTSCINHLI